MAGTDHPHVALLRGLFSAFATGDMDVIEAGLAPAVRWHTPGDNALAGDAEGRDAVLRQLARSSELTEQTYRVEVLDVMGGERHAAVLYRGTGEREGRALDTQHLALYAISEDRVTEVWVTPLDQAAFDAFWR